MIYHEPLHRHDHPDGSDLKGRVGPFFCSAYRRRGRRRWGWTVDSLYGDLSAGTATSEIGARRAMRDAVRRAARRLDRTAAALARASCGSVGSA